MATPPLAESGGDKVDGWPTATVPTVTSYMSLPILHTFICLGGSTDPFISFWAL